MNPEDSMKTIQLHEDRIRRNRDELINRRDHLVDQINSVFREVTRTDGISLREASIIDDYGTDEERAEARSLETDTHWSQVNIEELDPGGSCLSFVDPIGYRYYLPAYMIYSLQNSFVEYPESKAVNENALETTLFGLNAAGYESDGLRAHVRRKYANFTPEECICIARFLAFTSELTTCDDDIDALEALKNEWLKYLPLAEQKHLESIWPISYN